MIETEVSIVSLCYIEKGHDGRVWLHRLADVKDGSLCAPEKSDPKGKYFENRDRIFLGPGGPSDEGRIGIWQWYVHSNRTGKDQVESHYMKGYLPVRVVVLPSTVNSLEEVVEQLKNGTVDTHPYFCRTLFCYQSERKQLTGVLCKVGNFRIENKKAIICENVSTLLTYSICVDDIYNWGDKLSFLRELQIGNPSGRIPVKQPREIIRRLILRRSTKYVVNEVV